MKKIDKAEKIIATTSKLLALIEAEGNKLDDLQRAQVVQVLIQAKDGLNQILSDLEVEQQVPEDQLQQLRELVETIEADTQSQIETVDLEKVQAALERLSLGVEELIKRSGKLPSN